MFSSSVKCWNSLSRHCMKSERITETIQNNIYQQSRQDSSSFSHKTKVIMSRNESDFDKSIAKTLHFGVLSII